LFVVIDVVDVVDIVQVDYPKININYNLNPTSATILLKEL